jgi:site-specific DNA-cytosine methylase
MGDNQPAIRQGMAVRRLTPTECERLQGFPPVLEWRTDQMTRDEYCAALLAAGWVVVDCEAGEVYRTRGPGGHRFSEPQLVPGSVCNGYRVGTFKLDGGRRQIRLHRLVWIAANGIPPEGMVVAHQNNDKTDNRIANLRLITASENSTDAAEDGLYHTGLANPATKLAPELHQQICDDYRQGGITMRQLGERYGISKSRIHQIVTESGWTDGQSDSARYRQLGNAVCVNVAEWVGRRIMEVAS